MSDFTRYAIYWLPEGALSDWAEAWLGWDMADGRPLPRPHIAGLPRDLADLTAAATAYGLHATIKPPFRLAHGMSAADLDAAFGAFCADEAPVPLAGLTLDSLGGFLALRPRGGTAALDALAQRTVATLDRFRAPAPPDEIARRRAAGLTPRQEDNLLRWGYPHVGADFRFHITLTGRLDADDAAQVRAVLAPLLAPLAGPLVIRRLSLVGQTARGFRLIAHHTLAR